MSINRAQAIPEEVERQRVLARQRSATRSASFTSQEIEQQRALSRERNSTIRTSLTPEEAAQQRILASMRTMATRATASPKIGKEQRVLTRKRIATRRAAYAPEEVFLKKTSKSKQIVTKTGVYKIIEVEWSKSADTECKTSCLKKLIQQMSMSSLAESVCGICNIRCYQIDLRRVPLNKTPSIELLKTPDALCSVIPCIQRTQNLHSNEKYSINNDVDLAMVEVEAG
ncbi:unnamed protein product [Rotaria socialis]|uniref:Uncharacterized protein n=1 Tax=Rotaria socialis TaxID=392032 RepID=A0A821WVS2_9BILA|nr:unnamed protein product [Rotaria socialis]